jgi:hypothetical protein
MISIRPFVLLAIVLALAGCQRERASVAVDAGLLTLVPEDTVLMGALRVKSARQTAPWKSLMESPEINKALNDLARQTSFDVRSHLWELLWSSNGKKLLFYARGEFAPMGLEPKLEREGARRMNYKGSMLIGDDDSAVWFVNSSTAVFGPTPAIHDLIDSRDHRPGGPSPHLREQLDRIPPAAHLWFVAEPQALSPFNAGGSGPGLANLAQNLSKLLQNVQSTILYADFADGVHYQLSAVCTDEKSARQVHDSLRGLIGIARFSVQPNQKEILIPVLDSMLVEQKNVETQLKGSLTTEQYLRLFAQVKPLQGNGQ